MIDAIRHLCLEAEAGGFQVEMSLPAGRPPYLVFELVGDTTARGLAAAVELRELFNTVEGASDAIFHEFMGTGAVLHPVTDPQKLFPIQDPPEAKIPPALGDEIIFLHDGPDGWAVLTKVDHVVGANIVIDVPSGTYTFPAAAGLQKPIRRPRTDEAARLDTWIVPATPTNRAVYLSRDYSAGTPAAQMETLIRHSPPNGRAMQ